MISNDFESRFIEGPGETTRMDYETDRKNRGTVGIFTVPRFILLYIIKNQWVASKKQLRDTKYGLKESVWVLPVMSA